MSTSGLILIHLRDFVRRPVEPADIYYLEADGDETIVRGRSAKVLRDVRSLGELSPAFEAHGFVRIHNNHSVNPHHLRELRRREGGTDWEVKLQPPVNLVLPVSRNRLNELLKIFEARGWLVAD
jgi:DNA-binding LytR/AlgR family response regulator